MVSKPSRGEPIARWLMTVLTALWVAGAIMIVPFGCAVGEFEEDQDCTVPEISVVAAVVLVAGVALGVGLHRRAVHWIGIGSAIVLAAFGWGSA